MLDEFYMYLIEVLSTTFDKICKDINDKLQNAKYEILNSVYIEYNSKPVGVNNLRNANPSRSVEKLSPILKNST